MKKKKCYENKWSVSGNYLSLFQCFSSAKKIILNFFSFFELGKLFEIGSEGEN